MGLGVGQILIILVIVLVIFGAGKLPKVMGDLGRGLRSFKDGLREEEEELAETAPKLKQDKRKNA
jgi:sec-independent protein translocase protein TatA